VPNIVAFEQADAKKFWIRFNEILGIRTVEELIKFWKIGLGLAHLLHVASDMQ